MMLITIGLGADNDDTVGLEVAADDAVDLDVVFDDAVGLRVRTDGTNKNDRTYLDVLTNQPRHIPYEIQEQILCHAFSQTDCSWPNQKCLLSVLSNDGNIKSETTNDLYL